MPLHILPAVDLGDNGDNSYTQGNCCYTLCFAGRWCWAFIIFCSPVYRYAIFKFNGADVLNVFSWTVRYIGGTVESNSGGN